MLGLIVRDGVLGVVAGVVFSGGWAVAVVDAVAVTVEVGTDRVNESLMFGCDMVRSRCCCLALGAGVENCGMVLVDVAGVT